MSAAAPAGLVRRLEELDRSSLAFAGGKAANLGEMLRAGLPVPPGFCLTTAAYARLAEAAGLPDVVQRLAQAPAEDGAAVARLANEARTRLLAAPVPEDIAAELEAAYGRLAATGTPVAVAVRSSATAEDLPSASFAGQQDTFLNVVGDAALIDAVRRCWASLWTDRSVTYRGRNGVDHATVRLAVVVQQMVAAAVAGVMFTANPLTGRRRQAAIDASPGLGEAVVSGAVNPDHFVVDSGSGRVLERRLGDKRLRIEGLAGGGTRRVEADGGDGACLGDAQLGQLAALGRRVEDHFGAPQDTEWALDAGGRFWLTQSRPITTLFPLPAGAPDPARELRVYFSFNVAQGVFQPLTPMGIQAFRLISSNLAGILGQRLFDAADGVPQLCDAASRLFLDLTPLLRSRVGREVVRRALSIMETRSAAIVDDLLADPRLVPEPGAGRAGLLRLASSLVRQGVLPRALRSLLAPAVARRALARDAARALALGDVPPDATAAERVAAVERLLVEGPARIFPAAAATFAPGLAALVLAERVLGGLATPGERDAMRRALPHNPTIEMDLALWDLAQRARADGAAATALRTQTPDQLTEAYHAQALPPALQRELSAFLERYGQRGVAEIDLGVPRWGEDPTHILGVLANYLRLEDGAASPDAQFRAAQRHAGHLARELGRRAAARAWWRGALVRLCYDRGRQLAGLREAPKLYVVTLLARARDLLRPVGEELAGAGRVEAAGDVYFLSLPEVKAALAGADLRGPVRERRAAYSQEMRRRHLPRFLLSDGTEPGRGAAAPPGAAGLLRGTPASAGTATGAARVVLDPTGARLEPGEILVAPSTDPGWTPLFLTAGGLVMEMGGAMSHGAVVAREYGIPAVVGVPAAAERITTGQTITVDGAAGVVGLSGQASGG